MSRAGRGRSHAVGDHRRLPLKSVLEASSCADWWRRPRPADGIAPAQRREIERAIADYQQRVAAGHTTAGKVDGLAIYPFFPQAGRHGRDLFMFNFTDLDPSSGIRDWDCSAYTYDGHQGHDSSLRSFREQDLGVPVYAVLDGTVVAAHDGEFDRNTEWMDGALANYVVLDHGGGHQTLYLHFRQRQRGGRGRPDRSSPARSWGSPPAAASARGRTCISNRAGTASGTSPRPVLVTPAPASGGSSLARPRPPCRRPLRQRCRDPVLLVGASGRGLGPAPAAGVVRPWSAHAADPHRPPRPARRQRLEPAVARSAGQIPSHPRADPSTTRCSRASSSSSSRSRTTSKRSATGAFRSASTMNWWPTRRSGSWPRPRRRAIGRRGRCAYRSIRRAPRPRRRWSAGSRPRRSTRIPDYDLVRYTFEWRQNNRVVRRSTNAALSDVLARNLLIPGQRLQCKVTPLDWQKKAPPPRWPRASSRPIEVGSEHCTRPAHRGPRPRAGGRPDRPAAVTAAPHQSWAARRAGAA